MFVIVPFVFDIHLVGSVSDDLTSERVMVFFPACNGDVIYSLGSCFLECAGDTIDPVADSKMSHNDKDNK